MNKDLGEATSFIVNPSVVSKIYIGQITLLLLWGLLQIEKLPGRLYVNSDSYLLAAVDSTRDEDSF